MRTIKRIAVVLTVLAILLGIAGFIYLSPYSPYQFGNYIPRDRDDAHNYLLKKLPPEEIISIKRMESEDDMIKYHMGLGMGLRNGWGLWAGSRLSRYFNRMGVEHPDDMSGIIFDALWCRIHEKPFNLEQRIKYYQDYWRRTKVLEGLTTPAGERLEFDSSWDLGSEQAPRTVHFGTTKDGRRWTYEHGVGVAILSNEIQSLLDQRQRQIDKQKQQSK